MLDAAVQLDLPLSAELRAETAALHRATETQLGLPGAIRTRADYAAWLARFFGLYSPLEAMLAELTRGSRLAPMLQARQQTPLLRHDLRVLGLDPSAQALAPPPALPDFAAALGAHYVLEGATLGGTLILKALQHRLGGDITGATQFFGGRGHAVGPMWRAFCHELDDFGQTCPARRGDVVAGAQHTFQTLLGWCS